MNKTIVDKVNDITLDALWPGPAAFWHRWIWDKIYAIHIAHSNRGLYGADMAEAPNAIIKDAHKRLFGQQADNSPCTRP